MNEQLIVKNFGPIKDATVDFKRVTVFIGPTGGGKSTLAKLSAMFSTQIKYHGPINPDNLKSFNTRNYWLDNSRITWKTKQYENISNSSDEGAELIEILNISNEQKDILMWIDEHEKTLREKIITLQKSNKNIKFRLERLMNEAEVENYLSHVEANLIDILKKLTTIHDIYYLPAERVFLPAIEYSWARNIWEDIGLPKFMRFFGNNFSKAREIIKRLPIPFLETAYQYQNGHDYIEIEDGKSLLRLYESASGFQSVIPLLVLLEYLNINTNQAQSFIIEEPELNLYPTAQQGLLNWLVEKCTKGENDLTITTHSPYLLAHFNTLLFAYQVAQNHPERADEIAKIVPRESWIDPQEFAAYHVEGQKENGVRSIVNPETGLISYNGLDAIASAEATEFEKLLDINAGLEVEW